MTREPTIQIRGETTAGTAAETTLSDQYNIQSRPAVDDGTTVSDDIDCVVVDPTAYRDPIAGIETLRDGRPSLPIIVYTANGTEYLASTVLGAGADDYVPHDDGFDLVARVDRLVGAGRDVTEHGEREREPERTNEIIEQAQEIANLGAWETDLRRNEGWWTEQVNHIFGLPPGYEPDEGEGVEYFHPEDQPVIREAYERALQDGESYDLELRVQREDETRWVRARGRAEQEDGAVVRVRGAIQDITERKERERELSRYRAFVENSSDAITVIDGDGTIEYMSQASRRISGHDPEELIGRDATDLLHPDDREEMLVELEQLIANPDRTVTREYRFEDRDGSWLWAESTGINRLDDPDIEGIILVTRDITERKERQQSLSELHSASRSMVTATNRDEIIDQFLVAADSILNVDAAGVFFFDEEENVLTPVDSVSHEEPWPGLPPIQPGESVVWDGFVDGQSRIVKNGMGDPLVADLGAFTSIAVVPLSDYGVFCCVSTESEAFDPHRVELIETLAANAEAVLQRAERERELRQRDGRLREQTERLEQLDTVNEQIRHIIRDLVGARTRKAIEEVVCTGLAAIDSCEFVWLGRHDSEVVTPTSTAGNAGDYLEAVQPILVETGTTGEPAGRAVASKSLTVVDTVAGELREGDWQREALSADFLSVLSVPLTYNGVPYGVLTIYADQAHAFGPETQAVFAELADAIAEAYHQTEQRRALVQDDVLEVEFTIEEATTPLASLVQQLDTALSVTRVLVQPSGRCFVFGELQGTTERSIQAAASDSPGVEAVRVIEETDDGYYCEIRIMRTSLPHSIIEQGGVLDRITADTDPGRLVATFPKVESVSLTLAEITDRFPELTVVETRQRPGSDSQQRDGELLEELFDEMTERQYEALEVAYQRGYFEVPRKSSGTEIAESMDVSAPTFLEHLRRAEQTIVTTLLNRRLRV